MATELGPRRRLRGSLSVWEAIGISIALMAPSMAANINPQGPAGLVGRAVPLAFVFATVGVLLVAYGFVRLCQRYNHAGSVYGFVGITLGPRPGVVAGWSLIGTYTFYACVTGMAAGIFGTDFLDRIGIWNSPPDWAPFLIGPVLMLGAWLLATFPARQSTRILLSVEGITVTLILVVTAIIVIKLLGHSGPGKHGFTLDVFKPASGTGLGDLFKGSVFGFLSFAGFEAAATLGEETRDPRRNIPRAILGTAIFGGIYFIVVTAVEMMGFGAGDAGVKAFSTSPSLLGDLGTSYVGSWVGDVITLGTCISAFGCVIACVVGATRILYALGRDGVGHASLGQVSERTETPAVALAVVMVAAYAIVFGCKLLFDAAAFDVFVWSATIGTLILLVAYLLAMLGAIRATFFSGESRVPRWELVIPSVGVLVLLVTLYYNIDPDAPKAFRWNYITAGIWVLVGVLIVTVMPRVTRGVGARLAQDEGLVAEPVAGGD